MENYLNTIKKNSLFSGIEEKEIKTMLGCLEARIETYSNNQFVFRFGENISTVGLVLCGSVYLAKDDFMGNRTIISESGEGQIFGETYACIPSESLGISVIAAEATKILFLDVHRIMNICSSACVFHTRLIRNLLSVLAENNLMLTRKMLHMSQRTTREKLLSYLSAESQKNGSAIFKIPFNRQQLADYLAVDRSAMSNELCKLRDEGILSFQKNFFKLN